MEPTKKKNTPRDMKWLIPALTKDAGRVSRNKRKLYDDDTVPSQVEQKTSRTNSGIKTHTGEQDHNRGSEHHPGDVTKRSYVDIVGNATSHDKVNKVGNTVLKAKKVKSREGTLKLGEYTSCSVSQKGDMVSSLGDNTDSVQKIDHVYCSVIGDKSNTVFVRGMTKSNEKAIAVQKHDVVASRNVNIKRLKYVSSISKHQSDTSDECGNVKDKDDSETITADQAKSCLAAYSDDIEHEQGETSSLYHSNNSCHNSSNETESKASYSRNSVSKKFKGKYGCNQCDKCFPNEHHLAKHLVWAHSIKKVIVKKQEKKTEKDKDGAHIDTVNKTEVINPVNIRDEAGIVTTVHTDRDIGNTDQDIGNNNQDSVGVKNDTIVETFVADSNVDIINESANTIVFVRTDQEETRVVNLNEKTKTVINANDSAVLENNSMSDPNNDNSVEKGDTDSTRTGVITYTKETVTVHIGKERFICTFCKKPYATMKGLKEHISIHCPEVPFRCEECGKGLPEENLPHVHISYSKKRKSISSLENKVVKKHECPKCLQTFSYNETYTNHMNVCDKAFVIDGEQVRCQVCHKTCNKAYLKQHCRVYHKNKPAFWSQRCNKNAKTTKQLETDSELNKHAFKCEHCHMTFSQKASLQKHLNVLFGKCKSGIENQVHFECDLCQKSFSSLGRLSQHRLSHKVGTEHGIAARPYICDKCSKVFRSRPELTRHYRIHTNEKPHKCTYCKSAFAQKCNLDAHLRVHTMEKPFECSVCARLFSQKSNLKNHFKLNHTDKPPNKTLGGNTAELERISKTNKHVRDVTDVIQASCKNNNDNTLQTLLSTRNETVNSTEGGVYSKSVSLTNDAVIQADENIAYSAYHATLNKETDENCLSEQCSENTESCDVVLDSADEITALVVGEEIKGSKGKFELFVEYAMQDAANNSLFSGPIQATESLSTRGFAFRNTPPKSLPEESNTLVAIPIVNSVQQKEGPFSSSDIKSRVTPDMRFINCTPGRHTISRNIIPVSWALPKQPQVNILSTPRMGTSVMMCGTRAGNAAVMETFTLVNPEKGDALLRNPMSESKFELVKLPSSNSASDATLNKNEIVGSRPIAELNVASESNCSTMNEFDVDCDASVLTEHSDEKQTTTRDSEVPATMETINCTADMHEELH